MNHNWYSEINEADLRKEIYTIFVDAANIYDIDNSKHVNAYHVALDAAFDTCNANSKGERMLDWVRRLALAQVSYNNARAAAFTAAQKIIIDRCTI